MVAATAVQYSFVGVLILHILFVLALPSDSLSSLLITCLIHLGVDTLKITAQGRGL